MATTTDRAATIRAELKAKGITSRMVSVRAEYYSMGSSIHVTIKDATVRQSLVEAIATQHESIDRDQWGEILSGGNRFVHVGYAHTTMEQMAAKFRAAVDEAIAVLNADERDNSLVPVAGTYYMVGGRFGRYSLWTTGTGHLCECWDADGLAHAIARHEAN